MSLERIRKIKQLEGFKTQSIHDVMENRLAARISSGNVDFQAMVERVGNKDQIKKVETDIKIDQQEKIRPSLMDEIGRQPHRIDAYNDNLSANKIIASSKDAARTIAQLKENLADPDVKLKGTVQRLLKDKLTNINENLQVALSKVGSEYTAPALDGKLGGVVKKFVGMLSYGQRSLEGLGTRVNMLAEGGNLSPATMLTIQIKMNSVAQELEFFTSLLSKSIESVKTIMNVQV